MMKRIQVWLDNRLALISEILRNTAFVAGVITLIMIFSGNENTNLFGFMTWLATVFYLYTYLRLKRRAN